MALTTSGDVTILHTADLHLGLRPTRVPETVAQRATPAATWERIVERAIADRVDLVTLGGDVADRDNRFFEAYGPLERGLRRLSEAGIPAVAVAGNHDLDVLPRLADELPDGALRLLGRAGAWERFTLEREGRPVLHVDGWSFPSERIPHDPVAGYDLEPAHDAPCVGLVHGDLYQADSAYAPLSKARLKAAPVRAWLLGHIHKPWLDTSGGPVLLYPGSPQGLDPGEPGPHGPWTITISSGGSVTARQIPLARLRYERRDVDLSDAPDSASAEAALLRAVKGVAAELADEARDVEHVALRVRLTGRSPVHGALAAIAGGAAEQLALASERPGVTLEKVENDALPAVDLDALARGSGPPATLARVLLDIERDADEDALVRGARQITQDVLGANAYLPLDARDAPDPREVLRRQGLLLLDALLAQREAAGGTAP